MGKKGNLVYQEHSRVSCTTCKKSACREDARKVLAEK